MRYGFRGAKGTPEARFDARISHDPASGCWLWRGVPDGDHGYGRIKTERGREQAHRYSWRRFRAEVPDGKLVLHKCDTPLCVNPDHLFLGTTKDNAADMVAKGRQARGEALVQARAHTRVSGEAVNSAKLTKAKVAEIRQSTLTQTELAAAFGVTQSCISQIIRGKTWK